MELLFTKGAGKYDRMDVIRSGAATESVDCPKQGIIPHDMVHFAVESVLRKRGFLARLAEGEPASYRMAVESETDGVERLVETFQGDGWSGWNSAAEDILDLYRVTCYARECAPLDVTAADVEAVRGRILNLTEQWRAVAVGQSLCLRF